MSNDTYNVTINNEELPVEIAGLLLPVFTGVMLTDDGTPKAINAGKRGTVIRELQAFAPFDKWVKEQGDTPFHVSVTSSNEEEEERTKTYVVPANNLFAFAKSWATTIAQQESIAPALAREKALRDSLCEVVKSGVWGERGRKSAVLNVAERLASGLAELGIE